MKSNRDVDPSARSRASSVVGVCKKTDELKIKLRCNKFKLAQATQTQTKRKNANTPTAMQYFVNGKFIIVAVNANCTPTDSVAGSRACTSFHRWLTAFSLRTNFISFGDEESTDKATRTILVAILCHTRMAHSRSKHENESQTLCISGGFMKCVDRRHGLCEHSGIFIV